MRSIVIMIKRDKVEGQYSKGLDEVQELVAGND